MQASDPTYQSVKVDLGPRSYAIHIGPDLIERAGALIAASLSAKRYFIVSDETVAGHYLSALRKALIETGMSVEHIILPAGEATKSLSNLERVLDWLLDAGASRDEGLIALGGGVIGDLTGLAAALMKRGMHLIQIPTSLLAQVDSSVGGKTAINTRQGKNLIGSFYQPSLVLSDTGTLATLPLRQRQAGYAEIVKYGLIDDAPFFTYLSQNGADVLSGEPGALQYAIMQSCLAKARIVNQDEREAGVRALLNLGHTFGHALEAANGYGPELLHGEAVAAGIALAARYSAHLGLISEDEADRALVPFQIAGLKTRISELEGGPYPASALVQHMRQDKKVRGQKLPLILLRGIGKAFIYPDANISDLEHFLSQDIDHR